MVVKDSRVRGIKIILSILCVLGFLVWGVYYYTYIRPSSLSGEDPLMTAYRTDSKNLKEYVNPQYRFSILYPNFLSVHEYHEDGGAITVSFESVEESKGFQIFIVPYAQEQVTPERFKQDIPSGVRNDVKEITFNGAKGAAFYSIDNLLGDTREVWFINHGYLYEITSFKGLDTWLDEVLATWQFI